MKKVIVTLISCLVSVVCVQAKSLELDNVYKEVSHLSNCHKVSVGFPLMALARLFVSGEDAKQLRHFNSVSVLTLDECTSAVQEKWMDTILQGHFNDYSLLVSQQKEEEISQIWVHQKKDRIVRMIIVHKDDNSCNLVRIKGNFTLEELSDGEPLDYTKLIH